MGKHLLLETADLTGARSSRSVLAFAPLAHAKCTGRTVKITATDSPYGANRAFQTASSALVKNVATQLADFVDFVFEDAAVVTFPESGAVDEQQRLRESNPLDVLRVMADYVRDLAGEDLPGDAAHFPVVCGGFGFDFVDSFEDLPQVEKDEAFGDFEFMVPARVILLDHQTGRAQITALTEVAEGELEELAQVVQAATPMAGDEAGEPEVVDATAGGTTQSPAAHPANGDAVENAANTGANRESVALHPASGAATATDAQLTLIARATVSDEDFRNSVAELQERIAAGDIYQVVPSRGFQIACADPQAAYRALRDLNPSPYMFYFETGEQTLFGASPESCLTYQANTRDVHLHPIAGTRPRRREGGQYSHENDSRTELSLRTDAKETAEHVMLVDLARNDLARIAKPGTRRVTQLLGVEHYSHVSHLVSTVSATLADGLDALDAYRACMNMGTLTGAPKIEATRLLRQIEDHGRGAYGGAIGYLAADGSFDSCIVIRSAVVENGVATVRAGAGVVAASDPQAEADETRYKAGAVLSAIAHSQGATLEVSR